MGGGGGVDREGGKGSWSGHTSKETVPLAKFNCGMMIEASINMLASFSQTLQLIRMK